jgi:hypothetical protein
MPDPLEKNHDGLPALSRAAVQRVLAALKAELPPNTRLMYDYRTPVELMVAWGHVCCGGSDPSMGYSCGLDPSHAGSCHSYNKDVDFAPVSQRPKFEPVSEKELREANVLDVQEEAVPESAFKVVGATTAYGLYWVREKCWEVSCNGHVVAYPKNRKAAESVALDAAEGNAP